MASPSLHVLLSRGEEARDLSTSRNDCRLRRRATCVFIQENTMHTSKFDELLKKSLRHRFVGVTNPLDVAWAMCKIHRDWTAFFFRGSGTCCRQHAKQNRANEEFFALFQASFSEPFPPGCIYRGMLRHWSSSVEELTHNDLCDRSKKKNPHGLDRCEVEGTDSRRREHNRWPDD